MTTTTPRRDLGRHTISQQLRDVIDSRGLTSYQVAKLAGIDKAMVARFLSGERDLRLATLDRIAAALGLRLVEVGQPRRRVRATEGTGENPGAGDDAGPRTDASTLERS